MTECL